jgi:beta-lactamase superfamily II metal-dependent hydrolase
MLRLEALPAAHGDALLLTWGRSEKTAHRMLIDAGPLGRYRGVHDRLAALGGTPKLDGLVITHIDGDHIEGVVRLLQDRAAMKLKIKDVWFNGWPQLADAGADVLGADQGEMVGALLERDRLPWNKAFDGGSVSIPEKGRLPVVELPGGATVTLLGPGPEELKQLRRDWVKVLREVDVQPGKPEEALERLAKRKDLSGIEDLLGGRTKLDSSIANRSSISFLFEYAGRSLLLTGDGHGDVLSAGIRRLLKQRKRKRLAVDVFKLPHHCSAGNVTEELLELVETSNYVVSSNGAKYKHPDKLALQRVLAQKHKTTPTLWFNHLSKTTKPWASEKTQAKHGYLAVFPEEEAAGAVLDL